MAASTDDVKVRLKLEREKQFQAGMKASGGAVRGFGNEVQRTNRLAKAHGAAVSKMQSGIAAVGRAAGITALVGLAGMSAEVVHATKGWYDHQQTVRRTNAVLKSTQGAANVTAKHIDTLSNSLENFTGIDNDVVQGGANMLLTFTNIRNGVGKNNKIFDQATSTLIGMSQALGTDPKQAAIQLGKALNDPIKGITALRRVGVSFNDEQTKQITNLVKSGKTMQAQKIILRELNKEFPKVKATPFQRLMTVIRGLEDSLGKLLLPIFNKGVTAFTKFVTQAQNGTGAGGKFVHTIVSIAQAVNTYLIQPIIKAVTWIKASHDRLTALAVGLGVVAAAVTYFGIAAAVAWIAALGPIPFIIAGIAALSAGVYYAYQRVRIFRNIVNAAWSVLKTLAHVAATVAVAAFKVLWTILKNTPLIFILRHLKSIVSFIRGMPGKIKSAASGMWDGIKDAFRSSINWILSKWNALQFRMPSINTHIPGVGKVGGFTVGVPDIPLLANGGTIMRSGSAIVGDQGPELLHLDRGAQVQPLPATNGGDTYVFIDSEQVAARVEKRAKRQAQRR